jgi:RND family efflux transporter MFP subunit
MSDSSMTQPDHRPDLSALRIERPDETETPRLGRYLVNGVIVLVAIVAVTFAYLRWIEPQRRPEAEVMTVKATVESASSLVLTASGYLVADRKSDVTAKIPGRIARLNVEVGSRVRAGDVIAVLESDQIRAQLAEAEAAYTEASREYNRQKKLWEEGVTSHALLDGAEAQAGVAKARLDQARVAMNDTEVRAPFAGTVVAKNVEVGEVISPMTMGNIGGAGSTGSIATIADMKTLEVEADVNESNLGQLRPGQPAEISVDALPGRKFRGRLRQIVPTANRSKGIVQVKVSIADAIEQLLPEMSASVSFLDSEPAPGQLAEKPKIRVPSDAVVGSGSDAHVGVVDSENRVIERKVVAGPSIDGRTEITSGLANGERIITRDAAKFKAGQRVKLAGGAE